MESSETLSHKIASFMERRSGWLILAIVAITALLAVPLVTMAPDETASDSPGGPVYDLEDGYNDNLPSRFHGAFFLVEAREGDILTQQPLWELYQNTEKLKQADSRGELNPPELDKQPYLFNGFDVDRQQPILGVFTVADAVQEAMAADPRLNTTLEEASDDEVKLALHYLLRDPKTEYLKDFLSLQKKKVEPRMVLGQEIDYWTAPAITFGVAADNEKLGGGGIRIGATSDPVTEGKEHFNRKAQAILRGEQVSYGLWGVAIDAEAGDKVLALRQAAQGTGVALLASGATSIIGFTIMAFAPMPMFSSYGILTAVMIFMAVAASLLVLPSLLLLVTPTRMKS